MDTIEKWKVEKKKDPRWADYKDTFVGHLYCKGYPPSVIMYSMAVIMILLMHHRAGMVPSWRMVVSLEKTGVRAWGVYPGGQSGNPGSPYYNNMLNTWANW
jgi:penicillin amidase